MEKQLKEIDTWTTIRKELNDNYNLSEQWKSAVELFDKRINKKYLNSIEELIAKDIREGEGFLIVTIQCVLIELFAAFKDGAIYNHNKPIEGGLYYEYKDCGEIFIKFLNTEDIFNKIFFVTDKLGNKQLNTPFSGKLFYSQVRCGLMHEARTKGNWHINATKNDNISDTRFIKQAKKGNVIYRTLLHFALTRYFKKYKSELLNEDIVYNNLRRLFARKLDDLYDIKDDSEWWT